MPRLSDRAFQVVKEEIDRCYSDSPEDQLERVIILARLESLRRRDGKPLDRVQLWEELSDVSTDFNQRVIINAAKIDAPPPVIGASMGIGAVALLVTAAVGVDALKSAPQVSKESTTSSSTPNLVQTANRSPEQTGAINKPISADKSTQPKFVSASQTSNRQSGESDRRLGVSADTSAATKEAVQVADTQTEENKAAETKAAEPQRLTAQTKDAFETARAFGWQAALKSQNPPHSAQYWRETATLWTQAIELLDQVPRYDANYAEAQAKKAVYQDNLAQIQDRQKEAESRIVQSPVKPQFSAPRESDLAAAKRYGWQAALASQNAPHPPEKWADISQLWQLAIQQLNKIDAQHPTYAEAQEVKARYQQNLAAIRQRYQQEQNATQRLQSLRATLSEIEQSITLSQSSKQSQLMAIVGRLQTIPANTLAHLQSQSLIADIDRQLGALASGTSPSTATDASPRLAISSDDGN